VNKGCKKFIYTFAIVLFLTVLITPWLSIPVLAADSVLNASTNGLNFWGGPIDPNVGQTAFADFGNNDPRIIAGRIVQIFLGLLGVIAVLLIIYGGWLYMTAQGAPDKVEKAKKVLTDAIIGLLIILSAFAIATFVISRLLNSIGGTNGTGTTDTVNNRLGQGMSALGAGIVQSVYPEPGQHDVARNTAILVTFREAMAPESICDNIANGQCAPGAKIKADSVKIFVRDQGDGKANVTDVFVASNDNKTFLFTPVNYLGSPSANVWYTVELTDQVEKLGGSSAFPLTPFFWDFEVSSNLDMDPPQVMSGRVFPKPGDDKDTPKNAIIQINFNEAINPLNISGSSDLVKQFLHVVNQTTSQPVVGQFVVSNQYRTVEFIPDEKCGINGCGEEIYCLPGDSLIQVELTAATLVNTCTVDNDCLTKAPFNVCAGGFCTNATGQRSPVGDSSKGIVDVSQNSLDGNRDGAAVGPMNFYNENAPDPLNGDSYQWHFGIGGKLDLTPPIIISTSTTAGQFGVNLKNTIDITFSKLMLSKTMTTGSIVIDKGVKRVEHQLINISSKTKEPIGYWVSQYSRGTTPDQTVAQIGHSAFLPDLAYRSEVGSGVKDIFQNCFKPSAGMGCAATPSSPSCCNNQATAAQTCK
jgi:hypothetical protein